MDENVIIYSLLPTFGRRFRPDLTDTNAPRETFWGVALEDHGSFLLISGGFNIDDYYLDAEGHYTIIDIFENHDARTDLFMSMSRSSNLHEKGNGFTGWDYVYEIARHKHPTGKISDAIEVMKAEAMRICALVVNESPHFLNKLAVSLYLIDHIDQKIDVKHDLKEIFARESKRNGISIAKLSRAVIRDARIELQIADVMNDIVITTGRFMESTIGNDGKDFIKKGLKVEEILAGALEQMNTDYVTITTPPVKVKKPKVEPVAEVTPIDEESTPDVSGE